MRVKSFKNVWLFALTLVLALVSAVSLFTVFLGKTKMASADPEQQEIVIKPTEPVYGDVAYLSSISFLNGVFYNVESTDEKDIVTMYYDGNPYDYLNGTTKNPYPIVTFTDPLLGQITSVLYEEYNGNANSPIFKKDSPEAIYDGTLNVNNFGTYTITAVTANKEIEILVYSFGAKNYYRNESTANKNAEFTDFENNSDPSKIVVASSRVGNGSDVTDNYVYDNLNSYANVKTNQVPVWFASWGANVITTIKYLAPGAPAFAPYNGAQLISQPGKYFVSISFNAPTRLTSLAGVSVKNNFVFEISSANPELTYDATNYYKTYDQFNETNKENLKTTTTLTSNSAQDSYSNGYVTINQSQNSPATYFDKPYTISYIAETYDEDGVLQNQVTKEYETNEQLDTQDGHYTTYTITINFGTSRSYVAARFTVDRTPINFKSYFGIDSDTLKNNRNTDEPYTQTTAHSFGLVDQNSKLYLSNVKKSSGAEVTATVRYFGFSANAALTDSTFEDGNTTYVVAKYAPNAAIDFKPYRLGEVNSDGKILSNLINNSGEMAEGLSAPGLYQFEILDSAGNTTFYYAYIDGFTPNVVKTEQTDGSNTGYKITYGNYKAVELAQSVKLYNGSADETDNGLIVSHLNKYYLTTAINTISTDNAFYSAPDGWVNQQSLRNTSTNNVSGFITPYAVDGDYKKGREVTSSYIFVNNMLKANEGTYTYGVKDANGNASVIGKFSISYDLANVQILAKQGENDSAANYFGDTFANLASGAKATGTSFNVVEFDYAHIKENAGSDSNVPAFTLESIVVNFYEKIATTSTYSSVPQEIVLYSGGSKTYAILPETNGITKEGKYEFIWKVNISGTNAQGTDGVDLYDSERSQFVIIDRTDWFSGLANPQLTFQANSDNGKELGLKTADASKNIANIVNGKIGNTSNLGFITNSNLTPVGFAGIDEYRIEKNKVATGYHDANVENLIYELFKIKLNVSATNSGSVVDTSDITGLNSTFINKGAYNVSLSDGFNELIMFKTTADNGQITGQSALGAGINFKFNVNRISPSANFVDGENEGFLDAASSLATGNGIFSYIDLDVENGKYIATNVKSTIASVSNNANVNFSFDKDYVYSPSISLGAVEFDKTAYPQNASIDLDNIVVRVDGTKINRVEAAAELSNTTYMLSAFETEDKTHIRYVINFNHLADFYGDCTITVELKYKGNASDFGVSANETDFLTETYTLYIDNTAPSYNLNRVKAGDPIYQAANNNELSVAEADLNNYVYVIDDKFKFEHSTDINPAYLDTYKIFYRDTRIGSSGDYTFNENNTSLYKAFNYNTFANDVLNRNVVYQIVELDLAGNQTSYFVCLKGSQSLAMGITVENYIENSNVLSTYTRVVNANNNNGMSFYSYNKSFSISSLSAVNNFILYQIFDVTNSDNVKSLTSGSAYNNANRLSGNYVITSNANVLADAIYGQIENYNSNWKEDGAIFEVRIYDRLNENNSQNNAEWINFKLYFRPSGSFNFGGNSANDKDGYIYTNAANNIIIKNPTFNASYGYNSYYVYKLPDVINPAYIESKNEYSAGETTIVPTNNDDNYKLYVRDYYGQVIEKYFSVVADYANFASSATTTPFVVSGTTNTEIDNIRDKITSSETLSENIPITEIANDGKVKIGVYSDDLSFVYHNTFRHVNKVEVCTNVYSNNLTFNDVTDDKTYVNINEVKGIVNFSKIDDNSFIIYKVTTGFDSILNDSTQETYYAIYYTIMPDLVVYDSSNVKLSFSGENRDTIRTTFANVNYQLSDMDELLNTYVTLKEVNTRIDGSEVKTNEVVVDKTISLRISNTNYTKRVFTFTIRNNTGRVEIYNVIIDSTRYPDYQFVKTTNGVEETLLVSSKTVEEKVSNEQSTHICEQYFTNDRLNTKLILAQDKPLTSVVVKGLNPETGEVVNVVDANGNVVQDGYGQNNYTIYHIYSTDESTYSYSEYKKITYVPVATKISGIDDVSYVVNTAAKAEFSYPEYNSEVNDALDIYATVVDSLSNNAPVIDRTHKITLIDAGIYSITYRDISGNTHVFSNGSTSQTYNLINKILYTVSSANYSGELVDDMVLENYATVSLLSPNLYNANNLSIMVSYNGGEPESASTTTTFYNAGVYKLTVSGKLSDLDTTVTTTYTIYLVKPNEQRLGLEYVANNLRNTTSQVIAAYRSDSSLATNTTANVLSAFRGREDILTKPHLPLTHLRMSPYESGTGYYSITVATSFETSYKTAFNYNFNVLILDVDPVVKCSIEFGGKSSKNIMLSWVPSEMFERYGEVNILINGENVGSITEEDKFDNESKPYTIKAAGTYNIDITTSSGMILSRYVVTKTEPLSAVAIVLIVVGCVALVAGVLLFFLLRNKMKVK